MAGASPASADLCGAGVFPRRVRRRQWDDPRDAGTQIKGFDKAEFVRRVHEAHAAAPRPGEVDGYAPFCKASSCRGGIPGTKVGSVPITPENEPQDEIEDDELGRRARGR